MSRVVAVIQARLGSSRFPRKSLAMFRQRPMIEHVVERVHRVPRLDAVVVSVPTMDRALIDVVRDYASRLVNTDAKARPIHVSCGPERDVLLRYWMAACEHRADVIMRVTGDCPLWSTEAGSAVLDAYLDDEEGRVFWSNDTTMTGWPDGTDVEVFSMGLLRQARQARGTLTESDREHVTTWMRRREGKRCGVVTRPRDALSDVKLSVDTITDLLRAEQVAETLFDER